MKKETIIENYETISKDIAEKINNIYFEGEAEIYWIANNIGGVLMIADYFLDMDYMLDALKYGATEKQFFNYYQLQTEERTECNFKNYILYYKGFKK